MDGVQSANSQVSLPSARLARLQSDWLAGARARLLRQAKIHRASSILDLACGWGQTTLELAQRCSAKVTGIDLNSFAVDVARNSIPDQLKHRVTFDLGDAHCLPFEPKTFDLVFTQCSLLWIKQRELALSECRRVLKPNGCLAMIEPDYGGLMEHPPEVACRDLWVSLILQAGGDPRIGRSLPGLCRSSGFDTHVYFLDRYIPPHPSYLEFLKELPATKAQLLSIELIESRSKLLSSIDLVIHLPFWLLIARPVG